MLFSTYPPEALPTAGDTVCLIYGEPLLVLRRVRDKFGQVMLRLQSPDGTEKLEMVEACHWWPQVGDIGTGVPAIYQRWLTCCWEDAKAANDESTMTRIQKAFYAYDNPSSWLYQDFTIEEIKGDLATVSGPKFHGTHALPLAAIAVLKRPSVEALIPKAA
jgi:hypothetical protein